jgi:hypothetical protein
MASTSPPYPGLRPFRQDEHLLFFGRFDQTAALYRLLDRGRFLAVVGGSGSGKSSLVRAGLLPLLAGETNPWGAERWLIVALRPGVHPVNRLAAALCEAAGTATDPLERVAAGLRRTSGGIADEVGRLFPADREVLILVDQFEELFRYADAATGDLLPSPDRSAVQVAQEDEARRFVDSLLTASSVTQRRIRVVLTMRSDFVGDCARFPGLAEAVSGNQYLTPRLDRDQLTEAIVGPLLRVSSRLDPDARELPGLESDQWADLIEPRLVEQLENDAGDNPDQLPVLQHALLRCWQTANGGRLDLDRYRVLGGWGKVLSGHADEVQQRCGPARGQVVERVFRALIELDREGRAIRRPRTMAQLVAETGAPDPDVRAVVAEFSAPDCSFLVPPMPPDELVDIGHEALIRNWSSLRESWIEAERRDGDRWRSLLELAASGDRAGKALIDWWHTRRPSAAWVARWCGRSAEAQRELVAAHVEWSEAELKRELEEQHAREEAEQRAREAELRIAHEAQRLAEERASRLRESAEAAERFAAQQEALANSEKQRAEEQAAAATRAKQLLLLSVIAVTALIGAASFYLMEDKRFLDASVKWISNKPNPELTTSTLDVVAMRFLDKDIDMAVVFFVITRRSFLRSTAFMTPSLKTPPAVVRSAL